jgi:Spy/CpxP family protein refolding chaperone
MSHRIANTLRMAVVAACVSLATSPLMAQNMSGPPPDDSGHHGMHHGPRGPGMLLKGITLTSDQQSQIKAIHQRYRASMDSAHKAGNTDRSAMRTMMESENADVRNVLTADQQKIFDDNVAAMKQRMQQHRAQNQAPGSN